MYNNTSAYINDCRDCSNNRIWLSAIPYLLFSNPTWSGLLAKFANSMTIEENAGTSPVAWQGVDLWCHGTPSNMDQSDCLIMVRYSLSLPVQLSTNWPACICHWTSSLGQVLVAWEVSPGLPSPGRWHHHNHKVHCSNEGNRWFPLQIWNSFVKPVRCRETSSATCSILSHGEYG